MYIDILDELNEASQYNYVCGRSNESRCSTSTSRRNSGLIWQGSDTPKNLRKIHEEALSK